jgi:ATP-dependent protease ClpP protease subunit
MGHPPAIQRQIFPNPRPPAFISFTAEIVPQTTEALLLAVTNFVNQGFKEIHLLLSSPGGSVMHGIAIYNTLRGMPIKLVTHNVGNVDSIGTVVYLAGEERYACPQTLSTTAPMQFFERTFKEKLASVQADQERIKAIYCDRAGINPEVAEQFFLGESTINANDAVARGIAHDIRKVDIPAGSPILQLVFNRQ